MQSCSISMFYIYLASASYSANISCIALLSLLIYYNVFGFWLIRRVSGIRGFRFWKWPNQGSLFNNRTCIIKVTNHSHKHAENSSICCTPKENKFLVLYFLANHIAGSCPGKPAESQRCIHASCLAAKQGPQLSLR